MRRCSACDLEGGGGAGVHTRVCRRDVRTFGLLVVEGPGGLQAAVSTH
jgi:hypothetical protein